MNIAPPVQEILDIWRSFVEGRYDIAATAIPTLLRNYPHDDFGEFAAFISFFHECPRLHFKSLSEFDPFLDRRKFPSEYLTESEFMLCRNSYVEPISKERLVDLIEIVSAHSSTNAFETEALFPCLSTSIQVLSRDLSTGCLDRMLQIAQTLSTFDFSTFCEHLGKKNASFINFNYSPEPSVETEFLALEITLRISKWLDSCSVERIGGDYWTNASNWRTIAATAGLTLIHNLAKARLFSLGSKTMDIVIEALRYGTSNNTSFRMDSDNARNVFSLHRKLWIDPFDGKEELEIRNFILAEYLRLQGFLLGAHHPIVHSLRSEFSKNRGDDSGLIEGTDNLFPPTAYTKNAVNLGPSNLDEFVSVLEADSRNARESLLAILTRSLGKLTFHEPVVIRYLGRGEDWLQFAFIQSPTAYTKELTPFLVSQIIETVNSANRKVHVNAVGGSCLSILRLG